MQYERTIKPLVGADAFTKTQAAIRAFASGDGPKLQADLVAQDAANKHTSYISGARAWAVTTAPCARPWASPS